MATGPRLGRFRPSKRGGHELTLQAYGDRFGGEETENVLQVLNSGVLWRGNGPIWGGPESDHVSMVDRLEDAFSQWHGSPYALAVNSGTSANEAALAAVGVGPGDEVIVPALCPPFVPQAVLALNAVPIFADILRTSLALNPREVRRQVSPRTTAIVAVHPFGVPAPMPDLLAEASVLGVPVVEDCAQALGTTVGGRPVGTLGEAASFSLQQSKQATAGEGGVVVTRAEGPYKAAVLYSNAGICSYRFGVQVEGIADVRARGVTHFGHNHRMSELQGAVALAQIHRLDELTRARKALARKALALIDGVLSKRQDLELVTGITDENVSPWKIPIRGPHGWGRLYDFPPAQRLFAQIRQSGSTPQGVTTHASMHKQTPAAFPVAREAISTIRLVHLVPDEVNPVAIQSALDG